MNSLLKVWPLFILSFALAILVLLPRAVQAQDVELALGDPAPAFEATDVEGELWKSSDYIGKKILVVYFYPAAMTGGCTKQACAFRDDRSKLVDMGAEVVGISGDEVSGLQVFKKSHRLNFPLLSDADGEIARKFGVPVKDGGTYETEVDGQKVTLERGVTTARWTFIIDLDGNVVYKDTEVDAANDSKEVIAAIEKLQNDKS